MSAIADFHYDDDDDDDDDDYDIYIEDDHVILILAITLMITMIILFSFPIQIGLKRTTLELLTFKVFQNYRCWPTAEFFLKADNVTSGIDLVTIYRKHLKKISSAPFADIKAIARSIRLPEGRQDYISNLIAEIAIDNNVEGNIVVFYIIMLRKA